MCLRGLAFSEGNGGGVDWGDREEIGEELGEEDGEELQLGYSNI